jgi:hypothetical protein
MNAAGSLRAPMVAAWLALATAAALAGPVAGQGTWETTLHARDVDGNGSTDAFYDSALDVTWMTAWNSPGPDLLSRQASPLVHWCQQEQSKPCLPAPETTIQHSPLKPETLNQL